MVEVEDGGPAGWVGTGAGLQGLPAPNADLDTATEPRYTLRPLWLLWAPPHAATQHTCAVAPRARHMPGLQGARPPRWRVPTVGFAPTAPTQTPPLRKIPAEVAKAWAQWLPFYG